MKGGQTPTHPSDAILDASLKIWLKRGGGATIYPSPPPFFFFFFPISQM